MKNEIDKTNMKRNVITGNNLPPIKKHQNNSLNISKYTRDLSNRHFVFNK